MTIRRPIAAAALRSHLLLVHILLVRLPKTEINCRARSKILKHWVEGEALNLIIVIVLQKTLSIGRPDNNGIVCTTCSESLAVFRVGNAIDCVFVA